MKLCPVTTARLAAGGVALAAIFYAAAQEKKPFEHPAMLEWLNPEHPQVGDINKLPELPATHTDYQRMQAHCMDPALAGKVSGAIREGKNLYKLTCKL